MTTKLERKILLSFSIFCCWFFLSTLYLFQHVSKSSLSFLPHNQSFHDVGILFNKVNTLFLNRNHYSLVDQVQYLSTEEIDVAVAKIPFPQSINNEKMEEIIHPAMEMMQFINEREQNKTDQKEQQNQENKMLNVPKFWNPPSLFNNLDVREFLGNYGKRLISSDEAKMIGSYTRPIDNGDYNEEVDSKSRYYNSGKEILLETIFVSIASYRDYRCPRTLQQLFLQATYPERIRVAIVDQLKPDEDTNCAKPTRSCTDFPDDVLCKYSHLIDIYEMDAFMAVGPVLARHIGSRMYRGEYFVMQSDAHMEFVKGWDVDIINQWKSAKNEMAVLTTYVSDVNGHYDFTTGLSTAKSRPKMCVTDFDQDYYDKRLSNLMHGQQPEGRPDVKGEPTLQPFWAAGFSFSRGHFLIQVPYDQYLPMIFQGEEISIGLRGFTYGYDFYAPERSVIFHYYSHGGKDKKVKKFWENSDAYRGLEEASMARLLGITELLSSSENSGENKQESKDKSDENSIVNKSGSTEEKVEWNGIESDRYGIGKVRSIRKFLNTFGINIATKEVQHHLCRFVGRPMNGMFLQYLREDGMGIDYDQISFQFQDPKIHGKQWLEENGDDNA